jgi:hypothetical protein
MPGEQQRVDPASVSVIRITAIGWILGLAFVNAVCLVVAWLLGAGVGGWLALALLALLGVTSALCWFAYFWPAARYRHLFYRVADSGLIIRRGVLWRSTISIPTSRVQHTDVSQGPLQRWYGLATLVVHTAGTESASISLGGLSQAVALRIRDHLMEDGDDDAV